MDSGFDMLGQFKGAVGALEVHGTEYMYSFMCDKGDFVDMIEAYRKRVHADPGTFDEPKTPEQLA